MAFLAGSLVSTLDHEVPIEDIEVGDVVLGLGSDGCAYETCLVEALFRLKQKHHGVMHKINGRPPSAKQFYWIGNGQFASLGFRESIVGQFNTWRMFLIENNVMEWRATTGLIPARIVDLEVGMKVRNLDGTWEEIKTIEHVLFESHTDVYDIWTDGCHCHYIDGLFCSSYGLNELDWDYDDWGPRKNKVIHNHRGATKGWFSNKIEQEGIYTLPETWTN